MGLRDELTIEPGADSQTLTNGTVNGASADLQATGKNFQSYMLVVDVGTWTDGTHTFTLEDSPDDSVWTAVPAGLVDGTAVISDATNDEGQHYLEYHGIEQYVRGTVTTTGATTGLAAVVMLNVLGDPAETPVR